MGGGISQLLRSLLTLLVFFLGLEQARGVMSLVLKSAFGTSSQLFCVSRLSASRFHCRGHNNRPFQQRGRLLASLAPLQLELIFDINKTILLEDPAGGKSEQHILNEILADHTLGIITNSGEWKCLSPDTRPNNLNGCFLPSRHRYLQSDKMLTISELSGYYGTYSDFLDYKIPDTVESLRESKKARDKLKGRFATPQGPGAGLASVLEQLRRALALPAEAAGPGCQGGEDWKEAGLAGRESWLLLPSFLEAIMELASRPDIDLLLQFRTFGTDLPRVAREWNAFCAGRHPLSRRRRRLDGSDGGRDYRIHLDQPERFGTFHRTSNSTRLVLGTLAQPNLSAHRADPEAAFAAAYLPAANDAGAGGQTRVLAGLSEIWAFLDPRRRGGAGDGAGPQAGTLALRDFWPHWRLCLEAGEAGKLFLCGVGSAAAAEESDKCEYHQIFFDDNIEDDAFHIIDTVFVHYNNGSVSNLSKFRSFSSEMPQAEHSRGGGEHIIVADGSGTSVKQMHALSSSDQTNGEMWFVRPCFENNLVKKHIVKVNPCEAVLGVGGFPAAHPSCFSQQHEGVTTISNNFFLKNVYDRCSSLSSSLCDDDDNKE